MCGIAGILGDQHTFDIVQRMTDRLAHRGPDGQGIASTPVGVLGHRRLSIIDLTEAGKQPMTSASGRHVIVFNGEIYNYRELRDALAQEGIRCATSSDTEVLVEAWEAWGERCLDRLLGMFAFVVVDVERGVATLVRDRLGIKPLYYAEQNGSLYFASEIKALLAAGVRTTPNESMIGLYLTHGYYAHSAETFFRTIQRLPGGSLMRWSASGASVSRWWNLVDVANHSSDCSDEEVLTSFKALFQDSLRRHLQSDVPVGLNLSSGIDSLSLYYHLREVTDPSRLHVFSMGYTDTSYDETVDIRPLVERHGVAFHRVEIRPEDHVNMLPHTIACMDEPFGGLSTIAYDRMMSEPRKHGVIVLLEGQGVDEMLAGYKYYEGALAGHAKESNALPRFQDNTAYLRPHCLDEAWLQSANIAPPVFEAPFSSALSNVLHRDTCATKLPRVLSFNDHISMAHGLELRVPYLDHRLVELCFSLPDRWKVRDGVTKFLLRESVKGMVPEELRLRGKRSASSPQTHWYKRELCQEIRAELDHERVRRLPMIRHKELLASFDRFVSDEADQNSFFFWQVINLAYWYERFFPFM